jgi:SAM-dependent methyltransferase
MSPRPTAPLLADYYATSENCRFWADHVYPATSRARVDKIDVPRLERLRRSCERNASRRGMLVEIGLGYGSFAELAKESGLFRRTLTIGPGAELAGACKNTLAYAIDTIASGTAVPEADVAVAFDLIERVGKPEGLLTAVGALLAPNGLLVLSCPNALGFDILTLGARCPAIDGEHLNLFTPNSLALLLGRCGFEVVEIETPGNLDVEIVRDAALNGEFDLTGHRFLKEILIDDWERCGRPFQDFLSQNKLSSHMWCVARRIADR